MIYNLVAYLRGQLPDLTFVADGLKGDSPSECVLVQTGGGEVSHDVSRTAHAVQFVSRAPTSPAARAAVNAVYAVLKNKFGVDLPAVTVSSVAYPAIRAYQISPVQTPGYLGEDGEGLSMWSFNATVTTV